MNPLEEKLKKNHQPLMIIGAGGHARTVVETAKRAGFPIGGILDEARSENEDVLGVPLVGERASYPRHQKEASFMVAIGDNLGRKEFYDLLINRGAKVSSLIHPEAHVDPSTPIGTGTLVARGAMVCPNGSVGKNVIINSRALLEHDHQIGDHTHIGPDVTIAGGVTVGEGSFVGLRSVVRDGIQIGSWCTIGAGSVVVADVPDGATVIGNPGRIVSIEQTPEESRPRKDDPIVPITSSLREVLEKIDLWGTGFAFVAEGEQVRGLITDGMIRRFFLSQGHLEDPVTQLMNQDFIHLLEGQEAEAPHFFSSKVHFIPVLSKEQQLVRVIYRDEIFTPSIGEGQNESRQMRDLYHWVTHRKAAFYQTEHLKGKLSEHWPGLKFSIVASAQEALNTFLGLEGGDWKQDAADWWAGSYTQSPTSNSDKGPPVIFSSDGTQEFPLADRGLILANSLSAFEKTLPKLPQGWSILLRACPEDELNFEGGAILCGEDFSALQPPHPLQLASGASRAKNWFRELDSR